MALLAPVCCPVVRGRDATILTVARGSVMIAPMGTEPRYRLADLARVTGVTPRTVRYYIVGGLLPGANEGGKGAWYDERHLIRLRLIRELQRQHLPLAEIRERLAQLADSEVAELLTLQGSKPPDAAGSALEYVRSLLGGTSQTPPPPSMHVAASGPAPLLRRSASAPGRVLTDASAPSIAVPSALVSSAAVPSAPEPSAPEPRQAAPAPERSQWDRIALTNDIELHVRRPQSRLENRRVERLITIARQVLGEEQP